MSDATVIERAVAFRPLPKCRCHASSIGEMVDADGNGIGTYCGSCANTILRRVEKARFMAERRVGGALYVKVMVALVVLATVARADPPPGTDLTSPLHQWFDSQHSVAGAWCCRISDGYVLDSDAWRTVGDHYEVRIGERWVVIPASAMRDTAGGPNPTGSAIVWYLVNETGLHLYCFAPGSTL